MSLIELRIKGISYSQTQNEAYTLILEELEGETILPIVIGAFEAQSIAIALETRLRPKRPLTHDLFKALSERFTIKVEKVIIHKLIDGIFFSNLICERKGKKEIINSRTSDAIAIAIRFKAPIYTYKNIIEKAGILIKISEDLSAKKTKEKHGNLGDDLGSILENEDNIPNLSLKELNEKLKKAVVNEDYELAAMIRDEINKRN